MDSIALRRSRKVFNPSDDAIKRAWRNWGRQVRVSPSPNLASPRYLDACRVELRRLVPVVLQWHAALPSDKKYLYQAGP